MTSTGSPYASSSAVATYRETAPLKVPGLADLHRMTMLLLAEHAREHANILVVGAGGGLETLALAQVQPTWRFVGVDPSAAMLALAGESLRPVEERVELIEGTIEQAPEGPYDGATSLLTLHHIGPPERLHTLRQIHQRLRPGARLVIAGHAAPQPDAERWMTRSVAFGNRRELDWETSTGTARMMASRLALLTPAEERALLYDAGFSNVELFYAAFSFRGWVATAGPR